MRTSFRLAAVTLVFAVGLSLGGCAPDAPAPKPTASPSATPLFATDEEALAAAEEAYAAYLRVTDQVLSEGGSDPERLEAVVTGPQLETDVAEMAEAASLGYRSTGTTQFDQVVLQRVGTASEDAVTVYLCQDVADVDIFDASGRSIIAKDRRARSKFEVSFDAEKRGSSQELLVARQTPWEDEPC